MLMNSKVYEDIIRNVPKYPPEIGGIMGGKNNIIQCIFFDDGIKTEKYCSYNPNTELLNEVINKWIFQDIEFYGIFHTHFFDVQTLSIEDKNYIKKIMKSMPEKIKKLYFPIIVLPQKSIVPYYAENTGDNIIISKEKLKYV